MKHQVDLFTGISLTDHAGRFDCNLPEAAFIYLDNKGNIIDCNNLFCSWYDVDRSDIIGLNLLSESHNENLRNSLENIKEEHSLIYEGMLSCIGSAEEVQVTGCFLLLKKQNSTNDDIIGFLERSDDQQYVLPESIRNAEYLRIIAENSREAFSLHSLDGRFLYISPSVEQLHGYSKEEILKLGPFQAIYPDDVHIINEVLEKLGKSQDSFTVQYRMVHKNGNILWVESICQSIGNEEGTIARISVITRDITSAKSLDISLKQNEEKYRTLVMNLPTGVVLFDTKGKILEVNKALLEILGSPGEETTKLINLFEFENLINSGITDDLKKCIIEKRVINGQSEYTSKWGKKNYLVYSAVPLFSSEGEVTEVIGNVRDVTRIKKAEEKSQQQVDFLNLVINTMQEPFFVKDEQHKWIMLNDAAIEMMGRLREELIGKSDYDLFPKDQADVFWANDSLVFEKGSNVNEEKITWSDGSERVIITHKQLYTEYLSGKKFIVGTIHDITELKKTEVKLRESESKYRDLFDNANDFIFTTDLNGVFTNANKAMLERIGIPMKELHNYTIYSFCKPEILEKAKEITADLISNGSALPFEIETPEIEGKSVILEILARLIYKNNKPIGIQGIARDISEKKLASTKLEQFNKDLQEINASKDKFFSIIAHDLKSPFSTLIGFSELLLEDFDALSKDEMRDYVGIIRNTAKNSLVLLENLLAWSRLQTGRMAFNPVKLSLVKEVVATINILFSLSYRKKIHIENIIDKGIYVKADQNMLLSIMHNLVMNAIKFTPVGGKITISCDCLPTDKNAKDNQPLVEISVSDTGIGMSQEDISRLFSLTKPFTMPGTDKETGTGLGLILSREMVEKHGGSIKIVSELGKGSKFSFQIPLFVPEQE